MDPVTGTVLGVMTIGGVITKAISDSRALKMVQSRNHAIMFVGGAVVAGTVIIAVIMYLSQKDINSRAFGFLDKNGSKLDSKQMSSIVEELINKSGDLNKELGETARRVVGLGSVVPSISAQSLPIYNESTYNDAASFLSDENNLNKLRRILGLKAGVTKEMILDMIK